MSAIPTWLGLLTSCMVLVMFAIGVGVFTNRELTMTLTGHTEGGAYAILSARSFFLGALGAFYLYLGNVEALTVLLGLGVFFAIFDAVLERRHGAAWAPHLVFLIPVIILFYSFYSIYTTGAV